MNLLLPLQRISFDAMTDAVFVTGSIVEGFGNPLSDIDYFIFTNEPKSGMIFRDPDVDRWIDVTYFDKNSISEAGNRIHNLDTIRVAKTSEFTGIEYRHADFLHRLRIGQWLSKKRIEVEVDWKQFELVLAKSALEPGRSRVIDAIGELRAGNLNSALHIAEKAARILLESYLCLLGQTNPNEKWHVRKWSAVSGQGIIFAPAEVLFKNLEELRRSTADEDVVMNILKGSSRLLFSIAYYILTDEWQDLGNSANLSRIDIDGADLILVDDSNLIVSKFDNIEDVRLYLKSPH